MKKVRNPNYYRHIFDESERSSCHFPLLNINMKFHFDLEELNTQDHFWPNRKWQWIDPELPNGKNYFIELRTPWRRIVRISKTSRNARMPNTQDHYWRNGRWHLCQYMEYPTLFLTKWKKKEIAIVSEVLNFFKHFF